MRVRVRVCVRVLLCAYACVCMRVYVRTRVRAHVSVNHIMTLQILHTATYYSPSTGFTHITYKSIYRPTLFAGIPLELVVASARRPGGMVRTRPSMFARCIATFNCYKHVPQCIPICVQVHKYTHPSPSTHIIVIVPHVFALRL